MSFATSISEAVRRIPEKVLRLRAAYRGCFGSGAGEKVLRDLYLFCRMGQSTHVQGNEYETAFNEGKRAVFIRIFHTMKVHDERKEMKRLEEIRDE